MKTESEGGLKKVLTTTLVSVVLSPIGVALGWYLSHELARPRLQLEFVDPAYHMGTATLSGPAVERLRRNRDLVSRLRNILAMNNAPMECRRWLDGEDWDTSCHGVVADASIGLRDNLHLGQLRIHVRQLRARLCDAHFRRGHILLLRFSRAVGAFRVSGRNDPALQQILLALRLVAQENQLRFLRIGVVHGGVDLSGGKITPRSQL